LKVGHPIKGPVFSESSNRTFEVLKVYSYGLAVNDGDASNRTFEVLKGLAAGTETL